MLEVLPFYSFFISAGTHHLEPIRSTVFFVKELLSVCETPLDAAVAFRGIRAIEVGNVLVADVTEPVITRKNVSVKNSLSFNGGMKSWRTLTSGFYSHLQINPDRYCAPEHPPISHRRTLPLDPNVENTPRMALLERNPCPRSQSCSRSDRLNNRLLSCYVPADVCCLPTTPEHFCSSLNSPHLPPRRTHTPDVRRGTFWFRAIEMALIEGHHTG